VASRLLGRPPFSHSAIDLLSIGRTTLPDAVSFHFGFQPARMSDSLDYLSRRRPWRRMFIRYLLSRE
jgi:hypothetical protein